MSQKQYNRGDTIVAINNRTHKKLVFKCPKDGMCNQMLRRYVILHLSEDEDGIERTDTFIFNKQ